MRFVVLAYLACLTWLLLSPAPIGGLEEEAGIDLSRDAVNAVAHVCVFSLFAWLVFAARWPISKWLLVALMLAYAVATETLQAVVPGRFAGVEDAALNVAGVALGGAAYWTWRLQRERGLSGKGQASEP